jgi:hypothetical protein
MSDRTRIRDRKHARPGSWKLIDDRSGFEIMSYEMVIDHRGLVTSANNYDHPSVDELPPYKFGPEPEPLPFSRPEPEDEFIEVDYPTYD